MGKMIPALQQLHSHVFWNQRIYSLNISFLMLCGAESLSRVQLFATPWTVAHQAPLPMGILQATILEWIAMPSSRGSSQARDQSQVSQSQWDVDSLLSEPPDFFHRTYELSKILT